MTDTTLTPVLTFNSETMIDIAFSEVIAHEQSIVDDNGKSVFGQNVGMWRGLPVNPSNVPATGLRYLWLAQGHTTYFKRSIETNPTEGHCDMIFLIAQVLPKYQDGLMRSDINSQRNQLVRKVESSLISSVYSGAKDAMIYDMNQWYFVSGVNVTDTEEFYYGGTGQVFPYTGKTLPENWYISVLTATFFFNNRPR